MLKKHPGKARVTSRAMDRSIVRARREDLRRTATDIHTIVSSPQEPTPSLRTIRRRLAAVGLHGRRPVKKKLISKKNRKIRVDWAKQHLHWTRQEWSRVVCSDESKFNLFRSDGVKWIRRPVSTRFDPKYQKPTVKHEGGSVMIWGCFCASGMGPLRCITGAMDRFVYEDVLELLWRRNNRMDVRSSAQSIFSAGANDAAVHRTRRDAGFPGVFLQHNCSLKLNLYLSKRFCANLFTESC